jgi:TonB family protein
MSINFTAVALAALVLASAGCKSRNYMLAEQHMKAHEYAEAEEALIAELIAHPKNDEAFLLLGKERLMRLKADRAQMPFDQAEAIHGWNRRRVAEAWFDAAKELYAVQDNAVIRDYMAAAAAKDDQLKPRIVDWILTNVVPERLSASGPVVKSPVPVGLLFLAAELSPKDEPRIAARSLATAGLYLERSEYDKAAEYAFAGRISAGERKASAALLARIGHAAPPPPPSMVGHPNYVSDCFRLAGELDPSLAETDDEIAWHAKNLHSNPETAKEYLKAFPSGPHAADAREVIQNVKHGQRPGIVMGGVPGGVVAPPPRAPSASPQRLRVTMNASNLIKKVEPVYPPLAKQARIQGTVRFTAVIDKEGRVAELQLISGHPLLAPSAQEAVRRWMYKPTLLNGEPVEVTTQIEMIFSLSDNR